MSLPVSVGAGYRVHDCQSTQGSGTSHTSAVHSVSTEFCLVVSQGESRCCESHCCPARFDCLGLAFERESRKGGMVGVWFCSPRLHHFSFAAICHGNVSALMSFGCSFSALLGTLVQIIKMAHEQPSVTHWQ